MQKEIGTIILTTPFLYLFYLHVQSGYPHNPYNGVVCNDTILATGVFSSKELWRLSKGEYYILFALNNINNSISLSTWLFIHICAALALSLATKIYCDLIIITVIVVVVNNLIPHYYYYNAPNIFCPLVLFIFHTNNVMTIWYPNNSNFYMYEFKYIFIYRLISHYPPCLMLFLVVVYLWRVSVLKAWKYLCEHSRFITLTYIKAIIMITIIIDNSTTIHVFVWMNALWNAATTGVDGGNASTHTIRPTLCNVCIAVVCKGESGSTQVAVRWRRRKARFRLRQLSQNTCKRLYD